MPSRTIVATELANLLRQISHPDRIRLIQELQVGGHTVNEMAANLHISATRLSQHLAVLRSQGLVEVESSGQSRLYRLAHPELAPWLIDGIEFIANRITSANQAEIEEAKMLWRARSAVMTN
jgi:ArsR family transcriptional regulator, zinc-responsive transcriptional repressor